MDKGKLEGKVRKFADDVMMNLWIAYQKEAILATCDGRVYPLGGRTLQKMKETIISTVSGSQLYAGRLAFSKESIGG